MSDERDYESEIYAYMRKALREATRNTLLSGTADIQEIVIESGLLEPIITVQVAYDEIHNKALIEYCFNTEFHHTFDKSSFVYYISNYINSNFYRDMNIWPEIIHVEDGTNQIVDTSIKLTPYVTGYYYSLVGKYLFIEDKQNMQKLLRKINIAKVEEAYNEEKEAIYEEYYTTDIDTFYKKMYELNTKYNINADKKPDKKFEDFVDIVLALYKEYDMNDNSLVPEIYDAFTEKYNEFFGEELTNVEFYEERYYRIKGIATKY